MDLSSNRRRLRVAAVVVALALVAAACGSRGGTRHAALETRSNLPRSAAAGVDTRVAVTATDDLAAALYRRLAHGDGNVVFSPYSIELALAMTRNGARGGTRTEMDRVLGAPAGTTLDASLNALDQALASRAGTFPFGDRQETVSLHVADRIWTQTGLGFEAPFLDPVSASGSA